MLTKAALISTALGGDVMRCLELRRPIMATGCIPIISSFSVKVGIDLQGTPLESHRLFTDDMVLRPSLIPDAAFVESLVRT